MGFGAENSSDKWLFVDCISAKYIGKYVRTEKGITGADEVVLDSATGVEMASIPTQTRLGQLNFELKIAYSPLVPWGKPYTAGRLLRLPIGRIASYLWLDAQGDTDRLAQAMGG
jgi:hypothetical protein